MLWNHTNRPRKIRFLLVSIIFILTLSELVTAAIVFKSNRNGFSNIYVMNDDGRHVKQLTHTPFWDTSPRWSPDGKQIAFIRDLRKTTGNGQQADIFIINADGRNERRLTNYIENDADPSWSPDGKQIAFSRDSDIYIMEIATRDIRQLTKNNIDEAYSSAPSWSPDGKQIVHEQVIKGGGRHIYITDVDGKNTRLFLKGKQPHFVGDTVISRFAPQWAPNGQQVMYFEDHLRFEPAATLRLANHLIIVDKHGGNPKIQKIPENWMLGSACWAANGTQILFSASPNRLLGKPILTPLKYDIYRYHISSGEITQITDTPDHKDSAPNWAPHSLSVSPIGKLTTQWGGLKAEK